MERKHQIKGEKYEGKFSIVATFILKWLFAQPSHSPVWW
jgi:hypothetical protein